MKRITEQSELVALAEEFGLGDWHEPDEQDVTVTVKGTSFDNAGFWPAGEGYGSPERTERHVIIKHKGKPVAAVNLATLFAWATNVPRETSTGEIHDHQ